MATSCAASDQFPFRQKDLLNWLASIFPRPQDHIICLGHSRQTFCIFFYQPHKQLISLERSILQECERISQCLFNKLFDSMPSSCFTLLSLRRNHNPFWISFASDKLHFWLFVSYTRIGHLSFTNIQTFYDSMFVAYFSFPICYKHIDTVTVNKTFSHP